METFLQAYITCALWSSHDESDPETGGEPFDRNYDESDLAPETLAAMREECADFETANAALLEQAYTVDGYDAPRAGHDFWLTRNGHGAGFWDRGLGEVGDKLSDAADVYGSRDLYLGDDGKIHQG